MHYSWKGGGGERTLLLHGTGGAGGRGGAYFTTAWYGGEGGRGRNVCNVHYFSLHHGVEGVGEGRGV